MFFESPIAVGLLSVKHFVPLGEREFALLGVCLAFVNHTRFPFQVLLPLEQSFLLGTEF